MKRSEKWSSSSLFSRARSRGLALPLFLFFVGGAVGAPLKSGVARVCVAGTFHHGNAIVSEQRTFTFGGAPRGNRVCVSARLRAVTARASASARAQVHAGRTPLRCKAPTRTISKITVDTRNYQLPSRYAFFMHARVSPF